jgi:2-hydroxychromene-2-carboxylate isomerase
VVKQVVERYGSSLVVIVHPFPAPFHHNAFFASRALHVAQLTNASLVYPLLERIFATQDTFLNPSTNHETPAHVVSRLIALATDLGISANSFEAGFNDSVTDQATRISFKYGCSRGVVGTPTYLVNGVAVAGADESWSVDQWAKVFDPIVKATDLGMIYPSS